MKPFLKALVVGFGITLSVAGGAYSYHNTQDIWVNGARMTRNQVRTLEQHACASIPSGRYWLDRNTGVWGYEGGPARGQLGDACGRSPSITRPSEEYIIGDCFSDPKTGSSVCPGQGVSR